MTKRSTPLLTLSAAAFMLACGGNPPASTPQPVEAEAAAAQVPVNDGLSDERVLELGRGYAKLLHARDYEQLWQHLTPESKQRFGTVERFRSEGEGVLNDLGAETAVVRESVELPRAGMVAHKLYSRIGNYAGAQGAPMRLLIGLTKDGSIVAMQLRRVE